MIPLGFFFSATFFTASGNSYAPGTLKTSGSDGYPFFSKVWIELLIKLSTMSSLNCEATMQILIDDLSITLFIPCQYILLFQGQNQISLALF